MSDPASLPPPPPAAVPGDAASSRSKTVLRVIAVAAAAIAVVFGLLWFNARTDRDQAERERDLALSERDLANATGIALDTELQSTRDELAAAEALLAGTSGDENASDLQAEVDRLTAEVERLEAENASLTTDTATTTVAPATESAPATTAPATTAPATTTTTTTEPAPETSTPTGPVDAPSALEIGAWLSGLYRDSVLGDGQQQCLGESVLDALGGDRLAVLLSAVEDPGDETDLIEAVRNAAPTCGIDPSAIFG